MFSKFLHQLHLPFLVLCRRSSFSPPPSWGIGLPAYERVRVVPVIMALSIWVFGYLSWSLWGGWQCLLGFKLVSYVVDA